MGVALHILPPGLCMDESQKGNYFSDITQVLVDSECFHSHLDP